MEPRTDHWRPSYVNRRNIAPVMSLVVVALSACGAQSGASSTDSALAIGDSARTRLLTIADQQAAGCSGKAVHVQVAKSTRDVATVKTMQEVGMVGDNRPVWAILVTGGQYTCPHTGPAGSPASTPTTDLLTIVDASTYEMTDGGSGPNDTLNGLGPVTTLR
jgi:hypothetical protein